MSERIPTDVLVAEARRAAGNVPFAPFMRDLLTALADRLAELAALEPVLTLFAWMRGDAGSALMVDYLCPQFGAEFEASDGTCVASVEADTPEAAVAALAEQVWGRG